MRTKSFIYILSACIAVSTMTSCSSTKHVAGAGNTTNTNAPASTFSVENHVEALTKNYNAVSGMTSKVKVTVNADGKNISTSGSLKMKKNQIIQLTLIDPILGLMEVGRMEFTPTKVLIIDRINKQYIDVPYADISFMKMANIDFNTLQSLFWNELFVPGKSKTDAKAFTCTDTSATDVSMDYHDRMLHYQFVTDRQKYNLKKTLINNPNDKRYDFGFTYDGFTSFESRQFPTDMTMQFKASGRNASLQLSLSSMKSTNDDIEPTKPSSKYTKASADKILKLITQ